MKHRTVSSEKGTPVARRGFFDTLPVCAGEMFLTTAYIADGLPESVLVNRVSTYYNRAKEKGGVIYGESL